MIAFITEPAIDMVGKERLLNFYTINEENEENEENEDNNKPIIKTITEGYEYVLNKDFLNLR